MQVKEFVTSLKKMNFSLSVKGGKLILKGDSEKLSAGEIEAIKTNKDVIDYIKSHKEELIEYISLSPGVSVTKNANYKKDRTVIDLFGEQAARSPGSIALVFENQELSYGELDERSNQLAHYLQKQGVKAETLVPICVERSLEMVIGILGIMKAGGAYVPIDPSYPESRISYILEDTGAKLALSSKSCREKLNETVSIIELDGDWDLISTEINVNIDVKVSPEQLAYVIYTSGSTGTPKGVMIEHQSLLNYLCNNKTSYINDGEGKAGSFIHLSYTFDASVTALFMPLLSGKYLVIGSNQRPDVFTDKNLEKYAPYDFIKITPSHLGLLPTTFRSSDGGWLTGKLVIGGEALRLGQLASLIKEGIEVEIINEYGPTEATVGCSTYSFSTLGDHEFIQNEVPIGKPISNTHIYILNNDGRLSPVGVAGEICIGGAGLARGYLKRQELTAEKFISDPFGKQTGSRLYKTGDIGRWLQDGNIEYQGRIDDQVKIRGYRIELGEIESVLNQSEQVSQGVVLAKNDSNGNNRLVGYVVPEGLFDKEAIREYLNTKLPEYMVPAMWVELDSLPLTPNGKIDRKALPDPELRNTVKSYVAPRNETEAALAGIWQELLEVEEIGIEDDFFELGGHSLLAIRVVSAIRKVFGLELPMNDVFDYPTVGLLAARLSQEPSEELLPGIKAELQRPEHIPLSFSQERLWFIDRLEGSVQYHVPAVLRLHGELKHEVLEKTLLAIISRHEVLRTVIMEHEGQGYQYIMPSDKWLLNIKEGLPGGEAGLSSYITGLISKPFDLSRDYMLRADLIKLDEEEHILVVTMHHIASDGWSISILVKEVTALYEGYADNAEITLPELSVQYADYAIWQRQYMQGEVLEDKLGYWKAKLYGIAPLQLPSDYARPSVQSSQGATRSFKISQELSAELTALSHQYGATLYMTLLAVFKVLLYRYSGEEDICVGTPVIGRPQQELEGLIGFFINTLALRSRVRGDKPFIELLQEVKGTALEAYGHQEVPFEKVVDAVVKERDMSRSPLFQVLFSLQNTPEVPELKLGELSLTVESQEHAASKFDISLYITETSTGIKGIVEYATVLYREETIDRMIGHYINLLESIVATPANQVNRLGMLSIAEEKTLLVDFNNTQAEYPKDKSIVELFLQQVKRNPEAIAIVFENEQLTYKELNGRSNQLARYLQKNGVKAETLVPICVERSLEMVIGILGIMKAGGAYVPLDPEYPADRISYMLEDTGAELVLSSKACKEKLNVTIPAQVIDLDGDWELIEKEKSSNLKEVISSGQLAYVIYTSGSTGKPKGVMIEHGSVVNFMGGINKTIPLQGNDNLLAITSISFDISILELFWTICNGITATIQGNHKLLNGYDRYLGNNTQKMDFSLFYFASQSDDNENKYNFLLNSAQFADQNNFSAIWLPERHFHEFGGIFPNPAVLGAGLATITQNIEIRSGSVVLPLHDVLRVAEEWAVVDNLSKGRVSLSIASGWHADDFVLMPENYDQRHEIMYKQIEELKTLWRGSSIKRLNGHKKEIEVKIFPRPIQSELSVWITSAGNADTFKSAGKIGAKVLTHLLGQTIENLQKNIIVYKRSLEENGYPSENAQVALMLHTYIGTDYDKVKSEVKEPFKSYLRSNISLVKNLARDLNVQLENIGESDINDLLEIAFERYWQTAALLGTKENCEPLVKKLILIGVTEIACLIDFGIDDEKVINSLEYLNDLRQTFERSNSYSPVHNNSVITALQITPSYLSALIEDDNSRLFLNSLKHILVGGEKLSEELAEKLFERTGAVINNMYGPTETTIWSTTKRMIQGSKVTVGRPIQNTSIYILDSDKKLCPIGVPGELYIGGAGLSRGYFNKAALTQERFVKNPYCDNSEEKIYKTGDMAKWLPNGEIEIAGRLDDQVKIRGYRIELGEIESVLLESGQVSHGVVVAKQDAQGNKRLVGYVVAAGRFDREGILSYLGSKLPEYMIPTLLVEVSEIPLTANGKIDRRALLQVDTGEFVGHAYVGPETETEQQLVAIWQELLGVERVGVRDNFFDLGGHSVSAIRLVSKIRRELETEVAIRNIFLYPTISQLARFLSGQTEQAALLPVIAVQDRPVHIPLSYSQERLWFIDQLNGSVQYHIPWVIRLQGVINTEALAGSLRGVIKRHEVLRTVVVQEEGLPFQQVLEASGWELGMISGEEYAGHETSLRGGIDALTRKPFDLSQDYNLRADLIGLGPDDHILVMTLHHIASDGWSTQILVQEMVELYNSEVDAREAVLPPLPIQYADYSIWQRNYLQGPALEEKLGYWKAKLEGVSSLQLPTDYARPAAQSSHGAMHSFKISQELSAQLMFLSHQYGVSLYMTLLAAFKVLLYRYSGQEDICVGTPVAGRNQQELEGLIGFFINTLALRSRVRGDASFTELLKEIKGTTLEAYSHQEAPFEKVVDAVVKERDMSRSPLFQVMLILQNTPDIPELRLGELLLSSEAAGHTTSKFDISLFLNETNTGINGTVEYNTDLYKGETIGKMMSHYINLLGSIVATPGEQVGRLGMLSNAEEETLLVDFCCTTATYPSDKSIVDLFEEQVIKSPDAIAIIFEEEQLTYKELNARSNRLAHYLQKQGIKADTLVPVCIERSVEMVVGILGILKAGGAYVPVDPEYPADRISYMLEDTGAKVVLTSHSGRSKINESEIVRIIELDGDLNLINKEAAVNIVVNVSPGQLAYVIYTSGSTGRPKGVMIEHRSLVNYLCNDKTRYIKDGEGKTGSFIHLSYTFDASVTGMFMPLLSGKYLVIGANDTLDVFTDKNLEKYAPYDFIKITPSHLGLLPTGFKNTDGSWLTGKLVIGGETLRISQFDTLIKEGIRVEIINEYGPTEATVGCCTYSFYTLGDHEFGQNEVPIGKPVSNTHIYILSRENALSPIGVTGEICIGGSGLARGYLKHGELTAEKFIKDPFNKEPGARLYRTGDLGRWLPDGNIAYLGRIDDQVKIRGYRIELGEIENVLEQSGLVKQAVVLAREDTQGTKRLVGYAVAEGAFDKQAIQEYLQGKLPEYMIPALWVLLERLPLTSNGKIDRKALPDPEISDVAKEYVAPRTATETALALIWQQLLGVERVGIYDDFFELGGHSLLAMRVASYIKRDLFVSISISTLFRFTTISDQSKYLDFEIQTIANIEETSTNEFDLIDL